MKMKQCPLCKREVPELLYDLHMTADKLTIARMKSDFPDWSEKGRRVPALSGSVPEDGI